LHIGIDISVLSDKQTGIGRFISGTVNALQQIDKENTYFLFEKNPTDFKIFNGKWRKVCIPSKLPGSFWLQLKVPKYCRKFGIDVFWSPRQICPIFGMDKIKIINTIYDLTFIHYPETLFLPNLVILKILIPASLKKVKRVTTISNFIKKDIQTQFPDLKKDIDTIYCGRPQWKTSNQKSIKRGEHLFFVGNLEPRKNLKNLIRAMEIVALKNKEVRLHIGGPAGWKNREIFKYLENCSVKNNVKILGYLTEQQLKNEYLSCKAFVYPSLYEGFGLPVLEALMMDCPVITSKYTVMEEIAGGSVLYCDPRNPEDIADKILKLQTYKFDCQISQKILSKFSWPKTARLLLKSINCI